ncbi:DUF6427 family protein [Winogradskyella jejuensis]|uniref:Beta-carotene 15,15'-monooxygenase n=1 Tax=Winogradskyella jejuensis TaxID=1089305 RepID=A0A1M5MSI7_9FLAO|nr:DUF6427 family protein [Winogradskyella jejuensis]SHG80032.1 hypothetical protein SAMN05444148_0977 [Winogradskyella jejuensis]
MITSIFSKSKPFNLVAVAIMVVIAFALHIYSQINSEDFSFNFKPVALLLGLFYVFITDFIIAKNDLTKRHSYGVMVLGLLFLVFPEVFSNTNILTANLLVLFALRRLLSLHSNRDLIKKFFDAAFWIGLAALFYSWAILYLIVLFVALVYYWQNEVKHIAVSLFGLFTVILLLVIYNIILNDEFFLASNFSITFSLDFSGYNSFSSISRLAVVATIYIWSLVFYLKSISEKNKKIRPAHLLVIVASIVAIAIAIISPIKNGSEYVFLLVPLTIITANYIETIEENWFREIFVILLIAVSVVNLLL